MPEHDSDPTGQNGSPSGQGDATAPTDGGWQANVVPSDPNDIPESTRRARTIMSSLLGFEADHLGANDLAQVLASARTGLGETTRADSVLLAGQDFISGVTRPDPYSQTDRSAVDAVVRANGITTGLAAGDMERHSSALGIIQSVGFVPPSIMHSFREAINAGGVAGNDGKLRAYRALRNLLRDSPGIIDASQLPADDRDRIQEFRMWTEDVGLSESQAIERIERSRTHEGRARRDAMRAQFTGGRRTNELERRTFDELSSAFGTWFSSPQPVSDSVRALMVDAYRDSYRYWRERDMDEETARGMAVRDLRGHWGVSQVMGGNPNALMPFAPETVLGQGRRIDDSFDWVIQQSRNHISFFLRTNPQIMSEFNRGLPERPTGNFHVPGSSRIRQTPEGVASSASYSLVPTAETANDVQSGNRDRALRYRLLFRMPDGRMHDAGLATISYAVAQWRREEEFETEPVPLSERVLRSLEGTLPHPSRLVRGMLRHRR